MFNLKSDLKIYTCDKYDLSQRILAIATSDGSKYTFDVQATVAEVPHRYDIESTETKIVFAPAGCSAYDFGEMLRLGGIRADSLGSMDRFHVWAKANPTKTWDDFKAGTTARLSLDAESLDTSFNSIRPDTFMNSLCLAPTSKLAALLGKTNKDRGYGGRRRHKEDREAQLLRVWALYGVEVSISASSKDLDAILSGIALHDFGITHCETMEEFLKFIGHIKAAEHVNEAAESILTIDAFLRKFGCKPIARARPRSPYIREIADALAGKSVA